VAVGNALGHACVQGRNKDHARCAAVLDALMQGEGAARISADILDLLQAEADAARTARAEKAAATRVEFFAIMRGED
jgi:alpha-D-ribose 1-methylphosphonate 5-triphosphate synthase subunit PhnG